MISKCTSWTGPQFINPSLDSLYHPEILYEFDRNLDMSPHQQNIKDINKNIRKKKLDCHD